MTDRCRKRIFYILQSNLSLNMNTIQMRGKSIMTNQCKEGHGDVGRLRHMLVAAFFTLRAFHPEGKYVLSCFS